MGMMAPYNSLSGDGSETVQLTDPDFSRQLNISLRARVTLIVVITTEEERAVCRIREVCESWDPPRQCIAWDSVDGFSVIAGAKNFPNQSRDPLTALDDLIKTGEDAIVILRTSTSTGTHPRSNAGSGTSPRNSGTTAGPS